MKLLKVTYEHRAYSEDEAKDAILKFRAKAKEEGYTVGAAGYTYKCKKRKTSESQRRHGLLSVQQSMKKFGTKEKEKVSNGRVY